MREVINQPFAGQFIPHIFPNQVKKSQKVLYFIAGNKCKNKSIDITLHTFEHIILRLT